MRKLLALLLCLLMLVSLAACGNRNKTEEKDNKTYLVTLQKTMKSGEVTGSSAFSYDEKGRPTLLEINISADRSMMAEIVYDSFGYKIMESYTSVHGESRVQHEVLYDMRYSNGQLTHCDFTVSTGNKNITMGFDLQYDANGNLILLTYDKAYTANRLGVWHSFAYDAQGRLIQESLCQKFISNDLMSGSDRYQVTQCRYSYQQDGKVLDFSVYTAESFSEISPDNLEGLDFQPTPDDYTFCFDETGKLLYAGSGSDDASLNGNTTIYNDSRYSFDKNGNLLSTVQDGSGYTYGYTGFDLTPQEAVMAKRLQHGISEYLSAYMSFARMDPVYCEVAPMLLYVPLLQNPVYYLVPYPMWGTT